MMNGPAVHPVAFRSAGRLKKDAEVGQQHPKSENTIARVLRRGDDTIKNISFRDTDTRFRWHLDSCQSFLRHFSLQEALTFSSNTATRGQYVTRFA
jgi:hypothetical protein